MGQLGLTYLVWDQMTPVQIRVAPFKLFNGRKMTQEDKAARDLEAVTEAIEGEFDHPAILRVLREYLIGPMNRTIADRIAASNAVNIEELPPDVVRYWVAAKGILCPQGYTVTVNVHDWPESPEYSEIDVRPVNERDIFGYDSPPIQALFIISKKTGKLATNAEIVASLRNHAGNEPIDYENEPAYGLELLIRAKVGKLDQLGRQVAEVFWQASPGRELKERKQVSRGLNDYGYNAVVLYQPQTPEEAKEAKPPRGVAETLQRNPANSANSIDL